MNMNNTVKRIAIGTLGCRLNQYESDSIATDFRNAGYDVVSIKEIADVYIINTCTVTNKSDAKSRNMIRKARRTNPDALLFVIGCYADTNRKDIDDIEGVDFVIGNKRKSKIFDIVLSIFRNNLQDSYQQIDIKSFPENSFNYSTATKGSHTRSFVKIQDGCDVKCSYCKIPYARGKPVSKPVNEITKDIKILYDNGYREFILTGINIIYYNDRGKCLSDLLQDIYSIKGDFRIRLSSLEPDKITDRLLDILSYEKMGKHLHIPLQSGSNKILEAMRRRYNIKYYVNLIEKIKNRYPDLNITTDLIIGFPDETDEDFNQTVKIIKECNFSHIHTFKYSKRTGTPASIMPNQINEKIKTERSVIIRNISKYQNFKFRESQIGRKSKILIENISKEGFGNGFTDNYIKSIIPECNKNSIQQGRFINTKIIKVNQNNTIAKIIEN